MFLSSLMDVRALEAKGRKGSGGSSRGAIKESRKNGGDRGNRPDTKKGFDPASQYLPGFVLPIQYGPIPPADERVPNVMYIDPTIGVRNQQSASEVGTQQSAAAKTVMRWKSPSLYNAYAEKAYSSSSSSKSGPITYDGGYKSVATCSTSDIGSKSTAVYSTDS
jgi:hypothetical protein